VNQPVSEHTASAKQRSDLEEAREHLRVGRVTKAADISRRLLETLPNSYTSIELAAAVALAEERLSDAAELFKVAIDRANNSSEIAVGWCGLGQALRQAKDLRQAAEAFRRATLNDPGDVQYLLQYTQTLALADKLDLALDVLRSATRQRPDDAVPWLQMGILLIQAERHKDALVVLREALKRNPNDAAVHYNIGTALTILGHREKAVEACEAALRLDPEIKGYTQLANLKKIPKDDPRVAFLEKRFLDDSQTPIAVRIDAGFALAKIYDDAHEYPTAFSYLQRANALKRSITSYSIAAQKALIDRICGFFSAELLQRFENRSNSNLAPVFVLGMPRSGTTLVEQILAAHPNVEGGGELHYMLSIAEDIGARWGSRGQASPGSDAEVSADLQEMAARYAALTDELHKYKPRLTDKMPGNFMFVGLIHLLFPKASIIHCRRDPIATCFSCYKRLFTSELPYVYDQTELGQFYRLYQQLMEHWHAVLPGRILDVDYEKVIASPEQEIRRLLDFCELEFDARCLNFHEVERPITTASVLQVRRPIYTTSLNEWEHYRENLGALITALGNDTQANPEE
jgi:Tfp pilus assembly protein PilF